jgi:hypothetical protein
LIQGLFLLHLASFETSGCCVGPTGRTIYHDVSDGQLEVSIYVSGPRNVKALCFVLSCTLHVLLHELSWATQNELSFGSEFDRLSDLIAYGSLS